MREIAESERLFREERWLHPLDFMHHLYIDMVVDDNSPLQQRHTVRSPGTRGWRYSLLVHAKNINFIFRSSLACRALNETEWIKITRYVLPLRLLKSL
jgi:hypothetical protein